MSSDVLSDGLRAVSRTGAVYFDFELSSPWAAAAPPSRDIAQTVMPGTQRVIEYHLIARGTGWGQIAGEEPRRLVEGDLVVFPQGDAHVLSSAPGPGAAPDLAMVARRGGGGRRFWGCSGAGRRGCGWSTGWAAGGRIAHGWSAVFSDATSGRS